jgi:16S rRNA (guanine527-N7)-methyltransferase
MAPAQLPHIKGPKEFAAQFTVSRETLEYLTTYARLLEQWSKVQDLVAPSTLGDLWHRHMADSAQLLLIADAKSDTNRAIGVQEAAGREVAPAAPLLWADLGTGAGFPGMVIAIMNADRPGFRMRLYESNTRKCSFLREVARQTQAPVDILCTRIEESATHPTVPSLHVVTARALAPLESLLGLAAPLLADTTVALFLKGRNALREIEAATRDWRFDVELHPSLTDPDGRIVAIRHLKSLKGAPP